MAILFIDGFDHYATSDILKKWSNNENTSWTIAPTSGRRGGGAIAMDYSGYSLIKNLSEPTSTIVLGHAMYAVSYNGSAYQPIITLSDAGTLQFLVGVQADGSISVKNGILDNTTYTGTIIGMSSPGIMLFGVWQYIEIKATISKTVGSVVVRVNGVAVINISNVITQVTANPYITGISYSIRGSANSMLDDLYICNQTGTTNNNFLGDSRIDTLYPTRNGSKSQFTTSSGTDHWSLVNDITPNKTSYVSSNTIGAMDTYGFSGISGTATSIYGVQVTNAALKDDSGNRSISNVVISGNTTTQSKVMALSTSQNFYSSIQEVDPATQTAWVPGGVNVAEFGTVVV